jgi:hypothetical protein
MIQQTAAHRSQPQHPRSTNLQRSMPRTVAAHLLPPLPVDHANVVLLSLVDPNRAFLHSSQIPSSWHNDDRLNPPTNHLRTRLAAEALQAAIGQLRSDV